MSNCILQTVYYACLLGITKLPHMEFPRHFRARALPALGSLCPGSWYRIRRHVCVWEAVVDWHIWSPLLMFYHVRRRWRHTNIRHIKHTAPRAATAKIIEIQPRSPAITSTRAVNNVNRSESSASPVSNINVLDVCRALLMQLFLQARAHAWVHDSVDVINCCQICTQKSYAVC